MFDGFTISPCHTDYSASHCVLCITLLTYYAFYSYTYLQ